METTVHAMVKRHRPPDRRFHSRSKRKGQTTPAVPHETSLILRLQFAGESGIVVSTYSMVANTHNRSHDSKKMMEFLTSREWGFILLDEVHVVPAAMFRRVVTTIKAHSKLGLTGDFSVVTYMFYYSVFHSQQPSFVRTIRLRTLTTWLAQNYTRLTGCALKMIYWLTMNTKPFVRDLAAKGHIANVQVNYVLTLDPPLTRGLVSAPKYGVQWLPSSTTPISKSHRASECYCTAWIRTNFKLASF